MYICIPMSILLRLLTSIGCICPNHNLIVVLFSILSVSNMLQLWAWHICDSWFADRRRSSPIGKLQQFDNRLNKRPSRLKLNAIRVCEDRRSRIAGETGTYYLYQYYYLDVIFTCLHVDNGHQIDKGRPHNVT